MPLRRRICAALATAALIAPSGPAFSIADPTDVRVVFNEWGLYFPGDVRFPDLKLEVPKGNRLFFVNADLVIGAHSVTELREDYEPVAFDSGGIDPGSAAEVIGVPQLRRGTYTFICSVHAIMQGTLIIV